MEQIKSFKSNENFYNILTYCLITLMLTCDALAFQSIKFYGFILSGSGIIFPISYTISSIITYAYGFEKCKRSIFFMIISQMFFCSIVCIISNIGSNINYYNLYTDLWKVIFSSSIAVYTSMYINSILSSWLKIKLKNKKYLLTIFLSNLISQFILVLISYTINYDHILSLINIKKIILDTYIYKILFSSFIILFFSKILYKISLYFDSNDTEDINVRYNFIPFTKNNFGINKHTKNENKSKKLLPYIFKLDSKTIKINDVTEKGTELIVHFSSIDSLHQSKIEYNEFIRNFKYNTNLDDLFRLNEFYNKFTIESKKLIIFEINSQRKIITLIRTSDNKKFSIKYNDIMENFDLILLLSKEQIEWIFYIYSNFKNIESKKFIEEKETSTKLRLIRNENLNEKIFV